MCHCGDDTRSQQRCPRSGQSGWLVRVSPGPGLCLQLGGCYMVIIYIGCFRSLDSGSFTRLNDTELLSPGKVSDEI